MNKWRVEYKRGDGVIEIIVRDQTGRKEDKFVANQKDRKAHKRIGTLLFNKYGIDFTPSIDIKEEKGFFDY